MEQNLESVKHKSKPYAQSDSKTIVIAGATGQLGQRISSYLIQSGATVKALVRKGSCETAIASLRKQGAQIVQVDYNNKSNLVQAISGCSCIVSALSGLREVIVDLQKQLLDAAIAAGVPRFIPSDYCIDFTKLSPGSNRNLDLRREFGQQLDQSPVAATSILNGMFTDLATGEAPIIIFAIKKVMYWGNAEQEMDFTTIDNTAAYTAKAAVDDSTPRYLRIAGEVLNAKALRRAASEATGKRFGLLRLGALGTLQVMINITRALFPKKQEVFPPWQGMQYLHNMLTGVPKLEHLDNIRYGKTHWSSVREVLATRS